MTDWSVAEASVATLLVLCGVGGAIAAITSLIEAFAPMSGPRARVPDEADDNTNEQMELIFESAPKRRGAPMHIQSTTDIQLTRMGDADTSREAANILRDTLGDLRFRVWQVLLRAGPDWLTDTQLRKACEADMGERAESTYRKRRSELSAMGFAAETGVKRLNDNGRAEVVNRARTADEIASIVAHLKTLDKAGRKAWIAANKSANIEEAA